MYERPIVEVKNGEIKFNLFPKQAAFVNSDIDDLFFGGQVGPGKSTALLCFAALRRLQYPNSNGVIFRRTFRELEGSLILKSKELYPKFGATYNENKKCWTFPNGATQFFSYTESDGDVFHHQTSEYNDICFDEMSHFTNFQFNYLLTRCRSTIPGMKPLIRGASNPGNIGNCVPYGDVLTPNGWKDIKDFKVGDSVYTVDENCNLLESNVDQIHQENFHGKLVRAQTGNLFMECTKNHSVAKIYGVRDGQWTRIGVGKKMSLVPFEKLPGQATIARSCNFNGGYDFSFRIPAKIDRNRKYSQPHSMPGKVFAEFMGYWLSEGCLHYKSGRISIAQRKCQVRSKMELFFKRAEFIGRWYKSGFDFYDRSWCEYLLRFGKSNQKFVPNEIKNGTSEVLRTFFDAAMDGDGHWVRRGLSGCYYTISKRLADDIAAIAFKLGYIVRQKQRIRDPKYGWSYEIYFQTNKSGGTELLTGRHVYKVATNTKRISKISEFDYSGPVYCIGIPDTHSFVIRQNGSVWISGNSWIKKRYIDPSLTSKIWLDPATKKTMGFIPASLEDNPAIMQNDPGYRDRLQDLKKVSEKKYLALAEGRWDQPEGVYFDEFDSRPGHHILTHVRHPDSYTMKILGLDWGYADPACVLWLEITPMGRVFVIREYYGTRLSPKELADKILTMCPEGEKYMYMAASPEIWGKRVETENGGEVIQELIQKGFGDRIIMQKANNARIPGWLKVREYLSRAPDGFPWLQISPNCENLIRTLPALIHDDREGHAEDVHLRSEDHAPECLRYILTSLNSVPRTSITSPHLTGYEKIFGVQRDHNENFAHLPSEGRYGYGR